MPYLRKRHVVEAFNKLCTHASIVGIFGHRQVGKSTFLEAHSSEYTSLDDENQLRLAQKNASGFIANLKGNRSAIDECQLVPALFPALKLATQRDKRPGRYLLSGSVRFTSRKAIRESLTGRISSVELYPLTVSELLNDALSETVLRLFERSSLDSLVATLHLPNGVLAERNQALDKYLKQGGLPKICFIREEQTRTRLLQDILSTILDRDLRLVYQTSLPRRDLIALCQRIASRPLSPPNISTLSKDLKISPRTIIQLLSALESIFLLRVIPVEGGGRTGNLYWFEDQLEQDFLAQYTLSEEIRLLGAVYRNVRAQFEYRLGVTPRYFHYRTRAGSVVPLAIATEGGVLGFYPLKSESQMSRAVRASIDSFLKTYEHSKVVVLTRDCQKAKALNDRTLTAPYAAVL